MNMISIADLCRRTGLSSRTLRFYEARGPLEADRTVAGLRCYSNAALARLHNISAMKRAGFSLADIARLLDGGAVDLPRLIEAQLESLAALPVDPHSDMARAFLVELNALEEPFMREAAPKLAAGATNLYDHIDEWSHIVEPPFSKAAWQAITAASAAQRVGTGSGPE